jgi:hypothetical protein
MLQSLTKRFFFSSLVFTITAGLAIPGDSAAKAATKEPAATAATTASAISQPRRAACGLQNVKLKSISISSQVSGDRVRVCADWVRVSIGKGASTSKPSPKATSSATGVKASTSPVVKRTPFNRSVVATATPPIIIAIPNAQISPTTSVLLMSDATRHSKVRQLLGLNTLIRFTPIAYRWTFGDSTSSTRSRIRHRFDSTGLFFVRLSVTYSIDLKVLPSGKWISTPLTIKKVASPLPLRVGQVERNPGIPVFVIRNCLQMPEAIGC